MTVQRPARQAEAAGEEWQYQLRVDLAEEAAGAARAGAAHAGLGPLRDILAAHDAALVCQYDAFAGYCAEAEARGVEHYPLYAWTKAVIADAAKRAKYVKSFSLHVGGAAVYAKETADALEAALAPLVGAGVVTRLAKHDTNPANSPQMPEKYRAGA
ncbi:MAG: hypothetical protein OXO52_07190 [Rhodospirillales bacterium]|nr:hypothetical protein [Rhodospirillales bacterium]MDE0377814.1 hypothetical protein [Rhodospirillales bacterium]